MQNENSILQKDLELLELSIEFLLMAWSNGFKNLKDITGYPVSELMKKPGMNYRMLAELGEILNNNNLLDIIDED